MKPSEMTDEQLRERIANLLGIERVQFNRDAILLRMHNGKVSAWGYRTSDGPGAPSVDVPDYPNDLNACHEMEESSIIFKSWRDTERWLDALEIAVIGRKAESRPDLSFVFRATARQRCDAFVEVMEGR